MTAPPQPFKRPRRFDVARAIASGRKLRQGDCYRYATQEAIEYAAAKSPRPALRVVHGILEGRIAHAWVERGGFAYDWQTLALVGQEGRPLPLAEFYKSRKARKIKVYTARQAIDWMVKTGHGGPWGRFAMLVGGAKRQARLPANARS